MSVEMCVAMPIVSRYGMASRYDSIAACTSSSVRIGRSGVAGSGRRLSGGRAQQRSSCLSGVSYSPRQAQLKNPHSSE